MCNHIVNHKEIQAKSGENGVNVLYADKNVAQVLIVSGRSKNIYTVRLNLHPGHVFGLCDCPWGTHRPAGDKRSDCNHVLTAIAAVTGKGVSAWGTEAEAKRQKRHVEQITEDTFITLR